MNSSICGIDLSKQALEDLTYWQKNNPKMLNKIFKLFDEILRTPFTGTGKPEPLKFGLSGCWSRRITDGDRLVYRVLNDSDIYIVSCLSHYDDE